MATCPTQRPSKAQAYSGLATSLRRAVTTAALLAVGLGASPAYAGDVAGAVGVANAVYPSVPQRCGTVEIEFGTLTPPNDTNGSIAEAYEDLCKVLVKPGIVDSYTDAEVCSMLTHEWGHLAGRRFDNPNDPYHSPDPADNMYGPRLVHHPACGESDDARTARQAREYAAKIADQNAAGNRDNRLAELRDELSELKQQLRAAKATKRRAHGARRARYTRRIRRLHVRIQRLRAEYRSLRRSVPIPAKAPAPPHVSLASFGPTDLLGRHVEASAHSHYGDLTR